MRDVSLVSSAGELVAVWGRRRSGRSTLLRVAAGVEPPDAGVVRFAGRELTVAASDRGTPDRIGYCRKIFAPTEGELVLDQL